MAKARVKNRENKIHNEIPKTISPMLALLVNNPPENGNWLYEIKWDGYRAIAFCNKDEVRIQSRNFKPFDQKFYPIHKTLKKLNLEAVLDGEIVVLRENGITSFSDLQNWRSEADGELFYLVFDLLWLNGNNLMNLPLSERKMLLSKTLPHHESIRISKTFEVNAKDFLKAAKEMGLEGMIAKRADSHYLPGERTSDWIKIKIKKKHEVVIGGYTINEKSPKLFSSLLVGRFNSDGGLEYTGKIGTGFNANLQKTMMEQFKKLTIKKCPFTYTPDVNKPSRFRPNPPHAEAVWLSPKIVCEVAYAELTEDGIMRHPSFIKLVSEKKAKEVLLKEESKEESKNLVVSVDPVMKGDRKTLLNPNEETQVKIIHQREIKFNHLSKLFWEKEGITKRDLLNYYYQAAPFILPYLKNRPQTLYRFPNGIKGESFYQKDVTGKAPEWIFKFPYTTSLGENKNFLVVQDEADILWMANLGVIEMNPWNSTIQKPEFPDWCIIDIDPSERNSFEEVIETAIITKKVLDEIGVEGYCKTSGSTGLHIYIPMGAKYTYDECQLFGRTLATKIHLRLPKFTSIERYTDKRKGKIYVDFLQNRPKATLAAPYSVRPKPFAPVSMPLHWDEVKKGLKQEKFTLKNSIERILRNGDLFKPVLGKGINLKKIMNILADD